jgi:hypothetical protein
MLKLRRTHEFFLRLSASAALRQSAGSPRAVNTARPSSTRTKRPPRQPSGPPSKPPGQKRPTAHTRPIPSPVAEHRAPQAPRTGGIGASRDRGRPDPRRVRTPPETPGPRRAPAVTTSAQQPQLTRPSPQPPGTAKQHRAGFEPLTPSPQRLPRASGPCQRGRRHRGRARPCRRGGAIAARPEPCSASPAVPRTCPKHRSTAVIHGQPRSVRVPPSCSISPSGAVLGSFPSSR